MSYIWDTKPSQEDQDAKIAFDPNLSYEQKQKILNADFRRNFLKLVTLSYIISYAVINLVSVN